MGVAGNSLAFYFNSSYEKRVKEKTFKQCRVDKKCPAKSPEVETDVKDVLPHAITTYSGTSVNGTHYSEHLGITNTTKAIASRATVKKELTS